MANFETIVSQVRSSITSPDQTYLEDAATIGNSIRALDQAVAKLHVSLEGTPEQSQQLGQELHKILAGAVSQIPLASTVVACFRGSVQPAPVVAKKRRGRKPKAAVQAVETPSEPAPTPEPKVKRKRRTKAEMAAVRATAGTDAKKIIAKAEKILNEAVTLEEAGI